MNIPSQSIYVATQVAIRCGLVALVYVANHSIGAAIDAESNPRTPISEARIQWSDFARDFSHLNGSTITTRYDVLAGRRVKERSRIESKGCGDSWVYIAQEMGPADTQGSCMGRNKDYGFVLKRRDEKSGWVLSEYYPAGQLPPKFAQAEQNRQKAGPFWIDNRWLPDLVQERGFVLQHESINKEGGNSEVARIEFKYSPTSSRVTPVRDGWVELDPARHWSVIRYAVRAQWGNTSGTITGANEHTQRTTGLTQPLRNTRRIQTNFRDGVPTIDDEIVDEFSFSEEPARYDECTLTAFGLPKPVGHTPPTSFPTYIWLLALAGVFLILAGLLRLLARRKTVQFS